MSVDPTAETIRPFVTAAGEDDRPFVMLNLLAFDGEEGRRTYEEYGRQAQPHLERVGGEVIYHGAGDPALVDDQGRSWDTVMLVRYPSRAAFLEMIADPDYQETSKLRTAALADAVLQPTTPAS